MKVIIVLVFLSSAALPQQCRAQVKHPQEMDLSDLEEDIELMNWTQRRNNRVDCDTFYRRLVKHLFNKKRFQPDPTSNYYIASVPLRLKREQWELLVDLNIDGLNLFEVDDLLAEVLKQSNDAEWDYPVAQILLDHYRHQLTESLPSINSPIVLIAVAILVIFILNRVFHFSKLTFSAMILLLLMGICVVSYTMTYWDCLSDLEVERMIQLSKKQSANNPCKDYDGEYSSIWSSLRATVFGSSENQCLEHMRNTFKTSKKYCDPLDVFAKWFGKIQMSYFSSIIGGFLEMISRMTSSSNLFSTILFWVVGSVVFVLILFSFGKELIKHCCKGLFTLLSNQGSEPERNSSTDYQRLSSKMDAILEENQHMKRELSTIRECSVERSRSSPPRIKDTKSLSNINEEPLEIDSS